MRAVLLGSALYCAAGVAVAACDESSRDPYADSEDGGKDASSSSSSGEPNDAASAPDDGQKRAPDGCILQSTGLKVGRKVENVPRTDISGAVDWTNLTGAQDVDESFATVTLGDGQESAELRVSDFGLAIPENAATWGIEAELKRRAPQGGIEDVRVDIEIENQIPGFKVLKGPWPMSIVGTHVYGQAVDTWRVDLNPSDVNKSSFAVKLWVRKSSSAGAAGAVPANVESLKVAIWYCPK
jgi:hypothetical protein